MDSVERSLESSSELIASYFFHTFQCLAHGKEELAVKRPHRPAYLHHQNLAKSLEAVSEISRLLVQSLPAEREALVHVDAVVTVTDGAVDVAEKLLVLLNGYDKPVNDQASGLL